MNDERQTAIWNKYIRYHDLYIKTHDSTSRIGEREQFIATAATIDLLLEIQEWRAELSKEQEP